jgi:hypothetical protein
MMLFSTIGNQLKPGFLGVLLVLVTAVGCHSSKKNEKKLAETGDEAASRPTLPVVKPAVATDGAAAIDPAAAKAASKRIGVWQTQAKVMDFEVKPERLLQQFIREFNDGTVVEKVLVAPVQDGPRAKPIFYLVGMGQLNGQFRAMALPLEQSNDDGALYLLPTAARHFAEGSNCALCYFSFNKAKVTGAECSETSTSTVERACAYRTAPGNTFFAKK